MLGAALSAFLIGNASAQFAVDQLHGYAINGAALYAPSGSGHTGTAGDNAVDLGQGGGTLLTISDPAFLAALNTATAGDHLSVSIWIQHYAISSSSAFFFYSPSSSGTERGFQAHVPWSDDTIYFDTAGCCDGTLQRVSANISTYPAWTDDSFWLAWHNFVFIKNGSDKQIWIDGNLFLDGLSAGPLPTDFNLVSVGSSIPLGVGGSIEGLIDDFAVYGSGLSSNDVYAIANGTVPSALPGASTNNLLAFWNFNPSKAVIDFVQAGPNATVTPNIAAYFTIANGSTAVQLNSIKLGLNGTDVTTAATIVASNNPPLIEGSIAGATIYYVAPTNFPAGSTQMVSLMFSDNATPPNVFSNTWPVVVEGYNGYVIDEQAGYVGYLEGSAVFTLDKGGHTGKAGDRGIDLSGVGSAGDVHVGLANFLNQAGTNNMMSVSLWAKMHQISDGALAYARSVSSSGGNRGFAALAWGDDNLYFDTAGCCDQTMQRLVVGILSDPNYVDDTFWQQWHHYAFTFNGTTTVKTIYVDGNPIGSGFNSSPLPTDFSDLFFGFDSGSSYQQAVIDDVSIFATELQPASISALTNGVLPTALSGEVLLAYWDFNTVSPGPPFVSLASTPAPNSTNNLPNVGANVIIINRNTQVVPSTITLALDGSNVTSLATMTGNSAGETVTFITTTNLPAHSTHQLTVTFSDNATPPNFVSNNWSFAIGAYGGYSHDVTHHYLAMFLGNSHYSALGGGHTGTAGDRALDMYTDGTGGATVVDPPFLSALNSVAGLDTMSVSFWLKQSAISGSSAIWMNSPTVGRDFNAHCPWSDDNIYFDTAGCCSGSSQRISAGIATFAPYQTAGIGDGWWTNWHHFVFLKNHTDKQIYIDGQMFLEGLSTAPLTTDINELYIATAGNDSPHGLIDDVAVFGDALSTASITQLSAGVPPSGLSDPLVAWWNFDDVGPAFLVQPSRTPAANSTGASAYGPAAYITAQLDDGSTAVNTNSVRVLFNGVDVTFEHGPHRACGGRHSTPLRLRPDVRPNPAFGRDQPGDGDLL